MSAVSRLHSAYLRYFSKPAHERAIYRAIRKRKVASIVELGVGNAVRTVRMLRVAQRYSEEEVAYTGIDMFEARPDYEAGLTLKAAHRELTATGAKLRLVPGDPFAAMARTANCLVGTDLLVIGADQDEASLDRAWFYVPRILTPDSLVFIERAAESPDESPKFEQMASDAIEGLAAQTDRRRAA